jgi:hypothetical protein
MVLVQKSRPGFWETFQPSQGPLGLMLLSNRNGVDAQIARLMRSLPGYCLGFSVTQQDPDFTAFENVNDSTTEIVKYIDTSRIVIAGCFDEYWNGRGRYFVDDLRRQTKRIGEQGIRMEFIAERNPDRAPEVIREFARLETAGWKGEEGSAVSLDNQQGLFYREIMEHFCRRGEAVMYQLLFNDRVVACDLCLERDGMTVVLKIAYDESLKGLSPGKFLHREILRDLFAGGKANALEWYGRVHEWQQKLDSKERTMFHVNYFRQKWVPLTRQLIKKAAHSIKYQGQ